MYKSLYQEQKAFEKLILTASYEELLDCLHFTGVKPQVNKGKSFFLAAERGDIKYSNCYLLIEGGEKVVMISQIS